MGASGVATRQEVDALRARIRQLEFQITNLRQQNVNVTNRIRDLWAGRAIRRTVIILPLLVVGQPTDVTITWRSPMPSDQYSLEPDWPIPTGLQFSVKDKQPGFAVITLTATIGIGANVGLTVEAWS